MNRKTFLFLLATLSVLLIMLALLLRYDFFFKRAAVLIFGANNQQTGAVFGKVGEYAVQPFPVSGATVMIAGQSAKTDKNGIYRLNHVPIDNQKLVVEAPDHEKYEKDVNIQKGENKADISMCLTPEETIRRWLTVQKEGRFDIAYKYLHPQNQKWLSKYEYVGWHDQANQRLNLKIISFNVGKTASLDSWTDVYTGRIYKNVAEVDFTLSIEATVNEITNEFTDKTTAHLVKVDHEWKGFWAP